MEWLQETHVVWPIILMEVGQRISMRNTEDFVYVLMVRWEEQGVVVSCYGIKNLPTLTIRQWWSVSRYILGCWIFWWTQKLERD